MSIFERKAAHARVCVPLFLILACLGGILFPQPAHADELSTPAHGKTVADNGDGTYTIELSAQGSEAQSQQTVYNAADVVIVLDISGSMDNIDPTVYPDTYMTNARRAISGLADSLLTSGNAALPADQQVRVSLVTFNNNARVAQGWTTSASALKSAVNGANPSGGTNWADGLNYANALDSGRNARKYIVFLSDGRPTYGVRNYTFRSGSQTRTVSNDDFVQYYRDPAWTLSNTINNGNGSEISQTEAIIQGFVTEGVNAANRRDPSNDAFYSVSVQSGATSDMTSLANRTGGSFYDGTDQAKLDAAFDAIIQDIRKDYTYQDVSIFDTLSEHVEFADPAHPAVSTFKVAADGTESPWTGAQPVVSGKDISWELGDDYILENGSTYLMRIVVRPTQAALEGAASGDAVVFSNAEGHLTWHVRTETNGVPEVGPEQQVAYDRPTMTLPVSHITIQKAWAGHAADVGFVDVAVSRPGKPDTVVRLDPSNSWTQTIDVPAGAEGITYTLHEVDTGEGWDVGYAAELGPDSGTSSIVGDRAVELKGLTSQSATFTITNTYIPFGLLIGKVDRASGDGLADARFSLYADTDGDGAYSSGDALATAFSDQGLSSPVTGSLATDQDGNAAFYGLMPGTYWLVESSAPAGYQLLDDALSLVVDEDGSMLLDGAPVTVSSRVGSITVSNEKTPELPATGGERLQMTLAGMAFLGLGLALFLAGRKREHAR